MMRLLLPVLAALLLLVAGLSVASRVFSLTAGSGAAPCGDPTASCWTNGRPPIYLAKVQQRSIDPSEPYATLVSRLLNTGPNIPRLIAAAPLAGFGPIHAATASLTTAKGMKSASVQRVVRARMILWNLGTVPNGAILTFTIRADFPPDPTTIAYPTFYAGLPAVGLPPESSRIRNDSTRWQQQHPAPSRRRRQPRPSLPPSISREN